MILNPIKMEWKSLEYNPILRRNEGPVTPFWAEDNDNTNNNSNNAAE